MMAESPRSNFFALPPDALIDCNPEIAAKKKPKSPSNQPVLDAALIRDDMLYTP